MNMFTEEDYKLIEREFEGLRASSRKRCADDEQYQLVVKAFEFANEAHKGVRRRSGEPYILHPIAVAKIVVDEIGLGCKSICAALLHDVVEDTDFTVEDIQRLFGDKIASLVDGLTKIKTALDNDNKNKGKAVSMQAENFRRILVTLNDDVRIVLIKLADRLHNVRTIQFMPEYKRDKILSETMYLFIPLAHRLGLYSIKSEMENIWLKYREPAAFASIEQQLDKVMSEREVLIDNFIAPIRQELDKAGYRYTILKRLKTPYSIWKKMTTRNIPFEQIYDIYAVRIIFEPRGAYTEREQCWYIFSMITGLYPYKPDRTRDWIDNPKANGYEALHLTVMSNAGKWVEVQIRSERMNSIAERGIAAHWLYKNAGVSSGDNEIEHWLQQVRDILENPDVDAMKFLDEFHQELITSSIYVFTPKGESKNLAKGATALDFAYNIHSEIGAHAIAAKVNQRLVPLSHVLTNGDQVEIITSDSGRPKREWLDFLQTSRAKTQVMDYLKSDKKNSIKEGMALLDRELDQRGISERSRVIKKLIDYYKISSGKDELYNKIGIGVIDLSDHDKALRTNAERRSVQMWGVKLLTPLRIGNINKKNEFLLQEDLDQGTISFNIAECCSPIPGDSVVAFIEDDGTVTIHKKSCSVAGNLASKEGHRIVSAKWSKHFLMSYLARISLEGIDRVGVLSDLTRVISLVLGVNMRKLHIETHDEIFEGFIDLYVHNTDDLDKMIRALAKVKGIERVKRVEIN